MNLNNDIVISENRAICKSYAKINLTLDVLGTLDNGYHSVKMIMQTVNLFDLVLIDKVPENIVISTNISSLPVNEKNIAYKAASMFFEKTGISGGAKILIHKNIPIAAGLAGGSGNGGVVLCALNLLYNAKLSETEILNMAVKLGADVPYTIIGGTCLSEGIGEKLTVLPPIPSMPVVLVKPDINISTAEIYNRIDCCKNPVHPNTETALKAIKNGDMPLLFENMGNIMEDVTVELCPLITEIKEQFVSLGAKVALMSGSGPTVYGIFENNVDAKNAADFFSVKYKQTYLSHTFN